MRVLSEWLQIFLLDAKFPYISANRYVISRGNRKYINLISQLRQLVALFVKKLLIISDCWTYLWSRVFIFPYVSSFILIVSFSFPILWYYQRASWDTKINGSFFFCTNLPTDSPNSVDANYDRFIHTYAFAKKPVVSSFLSALLL